MGAPPPKPATNIFCPGDILRQNDSNGFEPLPCPPPPPEPLSPGPPELGGGSPNRTYWYRCRRVDELQNERVGREIVAGLRIRGYA